ncbi:MAG: hypothetical protein LBQ50_00315 [Planctomycetaceae bacterium]|nr:hypothetical protein [Planctomycetaceae bacterium]
MMHNRRCSAAQPPDRVLFDNIDNVVAARLKKNKNSIQPLCLRAPSSLF